MIEKYPFIDDLDSVMERLGGNEALLARLLVKFRDTYRNSGNELQSFLENKNNDEAYRIVHSVKGVSANLGIGKLYRISIQLEGRMKVGDYDTLELELRDFRDELETVIASLETEVCN
jgi:HPt (histidine-containing phosphotransfer) domain-containing protein